MRAARALRIVHRSFVHVSSTSNITIMDTERMPGWRKTARAPYWRARSTHKFRFVPLTKAHLLISIPLEFSETGLMKRGDSVSR